MVFSRTDIWQNQLDTSFVCSVAARDKIVSIPNTATERLADSTHGQISNAAGVRNLGS
jgi:hypothetical protein